LEQFCLLYFKHHSHHLTNTLVRKTHAQELDKLDDQEEAKALNKMCLSEANKNSVNTLNSVYVAALSFRRKAQRHRISLLKVLGGKFVPWPTEEEMKGHVPSFPLIRRWSAATVEAKAEARKAAKKALNEMRCRSKRLATAAQPESGTVPTQQKKKRKYTIKPRPVDIPVDSSVWIEPNHKKYKRSTTKPTAPTALPHADTAPTAEPPADTTTTPAPDTAPRPGGSVTPPGVFQPTPLHSPRSLTDSVQGLPWSPLGSPPSPDVSVAPHDDEVTIPGSDPMYEALGVETVGGVVPAPTFDHAMLDTMCDVDLDEMLAVLLDGQGIEGTEEHQWSVVAHTVGTPPPSTGRNEM
jgi:hypothetical protein